jgi:hypothetical protein
VHPTPTFDDSGIKNPGAMAGLRYLDMRPLIDLDADMALAFGIRWAWIQNRAWLTRGVSKSDQERIVQNTFEDKSRDLAHYLN